MISRAAHYGGFQSYGDKPITTLKPGQNSLERQYYGSVGTEPGDSYLLTYNRWNSIYSTKMNSTISPEDFSTKSRRPLDAAGKTIVQDDKKPLTSHWETMYKNDFHEKDQSGRTKRPD